MAKTLISTKRSDKRAIGTSLVRSKLYSLPKNYVAGLQEDADEFMRHLLQAMHESYLARDQNSFERCQNSEKSTKISPISQIFNGLLNQSVSCASCGQTSNQSVVFGGLHLNIEKANTLEQALDFYFATDDVTEVKCDLCQKKVSKTKQSSIENAPVSLILHLKRYSAVGNKLSKRVSIPKNLNLSKFSPHKNANQTLQYHLVSSVNHKGKSSRKGHYTAMGLEKNGRFYQFDDSSVRKIDLQAVSESDPYILFYELDTSTV